MASIPTEPVTVIVSRDVKPGRESDYHAWMHRVRRDGCSGEPLGQLLGEHEHAELGGRVGPEHRELLLALKVVHIELPAGDQLQNGDRQFGLTPFGIDFGRLQNFAVT